MKIKLVVILLVVFISSCGTISTGNLAIKKTENLEKLIISKTSMEETKAILGIASEIQFIDKNIEIWIYKYESIPSEIIPKSTKIINVLYLYFENEILTKKRESEDSQFITSERVKNVFGK